MSGTRPDDKRSAALDAYIEERRADGYSVETRTGLQAVIVRRHRLHSVTRWFEGGGRARRRLVVSVDQDGTVTAVAAEPRRW